MTSVAFVPIFSHQKILFNTKDAYKRLDQFLEDATQTICNKKPKTEKECFQILSQLCNKHYTSLAKKALKSERPKTSNTGYILYCNAKRPEVKEKHPQMLPHEITQEIGRMWKRLTIEEKKQWN